MPEALNSGKHRILELLPFGLTYLQIAGSLGITTGTAKWYMSGLFGKMQVRNRIEALARAQESRWLGPSTRKCGTQGGPASQQTVDVSKIARLIDLAAVRW